MTTASLSRGARRGLRAGALALGVLTAALAGAGQARAEFMVGLITTPNIVNAIVTFDSATPGTITTPILVTGLVQPLETIVGIDYRPTTRELFGVGSGNNLYLINTTTGVATLRAGLTGATLSGTSFGVDFNPVADLAGAASLRVISNTGQNLAINANTGAVTVQTPISGGTITSSAYTNNDVNPGTGTTLFGIDPFADTLLSTAAPAGGAYTTVGALGVDASSLSAFDISGSGVAFAAITAPGAELTGPSGFYTINLATGAATFVGNVGPSTAGISVRGLAALPAGNPVPVPATALALAAGVPLLAGVARRRKTAA